MSDCRHTKLKLSEGSWVCSNCEERIALDESGIKDIIESGRCPQIDVEPEGYYSDSYGKYLTNRRAREDADDEMNDPERNEDNIQNETPKWKQDYIDECKEKETVR